MKQLLTIAVLFSTIVFAACSKTKLRGSGSVIEDTRSLPPFTTIQSDGSTDIEVRPSSEDKVIVKGYENLVPAFETEVNNNTLTLKYKEKYINIKNNNISVVVYSTSVSKVSVNGSGTVNIRSGMNAPSFEASINGSGEVYFGDNDFEIVRYRINGSGSIYGRPAKAESAYINISGSGDAEVTATKYLEARISGSGDVKYWGNPQTVNSDISGSGKVTHN